MIFTFSQHYNSIQSLDYKQVKAPTQEGCTLSSPARTQERKASSSPLGSPPPAPAPCVHPDTHASSALTPADSPATRTSRPSMVSVCRGESAVHGRRLVGDWSAPLSTGEEARRGAGTGSPGSPRPLLRYTACYMSSVYGTGSSSIPGT